MLFVALGIRQCLWEDVSHLGGVGMDDLGRQVFCQTLDHEFTKSSDVRVRCEGFHRRRLVIAMKDAKPILFGRLKIDRVVDQMRKPYTDALQGFTGLILRGDKRSDRLDDPTPIADVQARLQKLGAKTVGDFYAACGFESFIVRDDEQKTNYLEITFSAKEYGRNPVSIR